MSDLKLKLVLCSVFACLVQTSCTIFDLSPGKLDYERHGRSRAWRTGRALDPIKDLHHVLDFRALVNQYGYPAEEHPVTTIDGYRLRLHRIPGSPSIPRARGKPVVYFQHGILLCSDSWVLRGPGKDLAYILADAGFDVWFGNARGNTYSRSHVRLSPDRDSEFWDFSWHEIAMYDVSMMIDYILAETGRERLIYVGHSMGTTMSYVLLSTRPEYNERVELVISLAPVAFWRGRRSPFVRLLSARANAIKNFVHRARVLEIFPRTNALWRVITRSCASKSILQPFCSGIVSFLLGHNPKQLNVTALPYYLSYFLSGASRKTLLHYEQNIASGGFHMYDYGAIRNLIAYNAVKPPQYNLNNVVAPVAIFYAKGDSLVSKEDPWELAQKLPNVVTIETVSDEQFTHFDFLFAEDLKALLLDRLMEVILKVTRDKSTLPYL